MIARPPPVVEGIVRLLLPPTSREHVSGDLSERYCSLERYLMDSLGVLPFVIASQVRRTTNWPAMALAALTLFGILNSGAKSWLVAAIPTLVAMTALILRDAYRAPQPTPPTNWSGRQAAGAVAVVALMVLLCQAVTWFLAPLWLLPRASLIIGLPSFCVIFFFLRLQIRPGVEWPPRLVRAMSATELLTEVRGFETLWRRAIRIELVAALVLLAVSLPILLAPAPLLVRGADALLVAGTLFVVWFLRRYGRIAPLPEGLGFDQSLSWYRRHLTQHSRLTSTVLWWYALPLALGPITLGLGMALQAPDPWPALCRVVASQAICMALVVWVNNRAHAKSQRRISQLTKLKEGS